MKLVMTMIVRDEEDILLDNILFHSKLGIDSFLILNNGSLDSTVDLIREAQKDIEIQLFHQPVYSHRLERWRLQLAFEARNRMGADLVICGSADEFWMPFQIKCNNQNLISIKKFLRRFDSVVTVSRFNCLIDRKNCKYAQYRWTPFYVIKPINYSSEQIIFDDNIFIALVYQSSKYIVNPLGLMKNSDLSKHINHWFRPISGREEGQLVIRHYPFRNWKQFRLRVEGYLELGEKYLATQMKNKYLRWIRQYQEGTLEKEFEKLYVSPENKKIWMGNGNISTFNEDQILHKFLL